jgi:hypothetical protein
LLEEARVSIKFVRQGAQKPACNWGASLERDGFTALTPHLRVANDLARLMLLQASLEIRDGIGSVAAEDWVSTLALARHVCADSLMISFLNGYAIDAMAIDNAAADLNHLNKETLNQLAESLEKLRRRPSLVSAVRVEQQTGQRWLIARLTRDPQDPQWQATFTALLGNGYPASPLAGILAGFPTAQSLARKLQELDPMIDRLEQLASMPYDQFTQNWPALQAQLKTNPSAELVMIGDFSRVRRAEAMADARLALLKAAIDVLRRGPQSLKSHPDPFGAGPFDYVAEGDGFKISSKLADKQGRPLTLRVGLPKSP